MQRARRPSTRPLVAIMGMCGAAPDAAAIAASAEARNTDRLTLRILNGYKHSRPSVVYARVRAAVLAMGGGVVQCGGRLAYEDQRVADIFAALAVILISTPVPNCGCSARMLLQARNMVAAYSARMTKRERAATVRMLCVRLVEYAMWGSAAHSHIADGAYAGLCVDCARCARAVRV